MLPDVALLDYLSVSYTTLGLEESCRTILLSVMEKIVMQSVIDSALWTRQARCTSRVLMRLSVRYN